MNALSILITVAAFVVGTAIAGLFGGPILMLASKIILRKALTFGQAFMIFCACCLVCGLITWPVHAGVGDIPEGQLLAQIMGWAISFGVMTAMVDKATAAGLTRSATVAATNFVIYLACFLVLKIMLVGALTALLSSMKDIAPGLVF